MFETDRLGDWADLPFFKDGSLDQIAKLAGADILPPPDQTFAALERTQAKDTRVIILGQDPYPTPGHAHGFAFSVTPKTPLPKSLINIFKELAADMGRAPQNGDLRFWADQGVLLLNTALSVPRGDTGGHAKLGWDRLTAQVLARLASKPRAYVLWGKHAQTVARNVSPDKNLVIATAHPSPLSAYRGFFGSKPFSTVNKWLKGQGETEINWTGP
ncbi:MAG: uracil-DNA glycosylase [Pseudomonadota bacterium]